VVNLGCWRAAWLGLFRGALLCCLCPDEVEEENGLIDGFDCCCIPHMRENLKMARHWADKVYDSWQAYSFLLILLSPSSLFSRGQVQNELMGK